MRADNDTADHLEKWARQHSLRVGQSETCWIGAPFEPFDGRLVYHRSNA